MRNLEARIDADAVDEANQLKRVTLRNAVMSRNTLSGTVGNQPKKRPSMAPAVAAAAGGLAGGAGGPASVAIIPASAPGTPVIPPGAVVTYSPAVKPVNLYGSGGSTKSPKRGYISSVLAQYGALGSPAKSYASPGNRAKSPGPTPQKSTPAAAAASIQKTSQVAPARQVATKPVVLSKREMRSKAKADAEAAKVYNDARAGAAATAKATLARGGYVSP